MKNSKMLKSLWSVLLIGGVFMIYGGILDVMVYFKKSLPFAPPAWHIIDAKISLICSIYILLAAIYLISKSFEIRLIITGKNNADIRPVINKLSVICITGIIADLITGYYARGFLIALLGLIYLHYQLEKKMKFIYSSLSVLLVLMIVIGFVWTEGK